MADISFRFVHLVFFSIRDLEGSGARRFVVLQLERVAAEMVGETDPDRLKETTDSGGEL